MPIKTSELPSYVIREPVKSRIMKPAEFAAATQLVHFDSKNQIDARVTLILSGRLLAICRSGDVEAAPSPRSWNHLESESLAVAYDNLMEQVEKYLLRGYHAIVDGFYLVPFSDTDIKTIVQTQVLPGWAFGLVYKNFRAVTMHVEELNKQAALTGATGPTAIPVVTGARGGITYTPRPGTPTSADVADLAAKIKAEMSEW